MWLFENYFIRFLVPRHSPDLQVLRVSPTMPLPEVPELQGFR